MKHDDHTLTMSYLLQFSDGMWGRIRVPFQTYGEPSHSPTVTLIHKEYPMETATKDSVANTILADLTVMKPTPKQYGAKLATLGIELREYPRITDVAIHDFLLRRLEKMPLDFYGSIEVDGFDSRYGTSSHPTVQRNYVKRTKRTLLPDKKETGGQWVCAVTWRETSITDYPGLIPEHVLDAAIKAKNAGYDDLRVVTIEEKHSPIPPYVDPLLVAFKNKRRFLIDYWDKDIDPTELETK